MRQTRPRRAAAVRPTARRSVKLPMPPAAAAAGRRGANPPRRPAARPSSRGRPRGRPPSAAAPPPRRSADRFGLAPRHPLIRLRRARPARTGFPGWPAPRRSIGVLAAVRGAVEGAAGIGVRAAGEDQGHEARSGVRWLARCRRAIGKRPGNRRGLRPRGCRLAPPIDMQAREVGGGRAPRQPGQVRKEAAVTSFRPGRSLASHPRSPHPEDGRPRGPAACPPPFSPRRHRTTRGPEEPAEPPPTGPACSATPRRCPPPRHPATVGPDRAAGPPATPYRVLARKYRPAHLRRTDRPGRAGPHPAQRLRQSRVAHAFMLTGVRGVGKTTTARIIARALNCIGPDGNGGPTPEPCGVCPECLAILADRHPDVQELDAASNNGIDDVRELRERLRYRPAQARFKVYHHGRGPHAVHRRLQRPAEDAGGAAGPGEIHACHHRAPQGPGHHPLALPDLPPASGCRRPSCRAHFTRIAGARIGDGRAPEALAMLARAADGSVRDGLSLLDQAIALGGPDGQVTTDAVRDMLGLADRAMVLDLMEAADGGQYRRGAGPPRPRAMNAAPTRRWCCRTCWS